MEFEFVCRRCVLPLSSLEDILHHLFLHSCSNPNRSCNFPWITLLANHYEYSKGDRLEVSDRMPVPVGMAPEAHLTFCPLPSAFQHDRLPIPDTRHPSLDRNPVDFLFPISSTVSL